MDEADMQVGMVVAVIKSKGFTDEDINSTPTPDVAGSCHNLGDSELELYDNTSIFKSDKLLYLYADSHLILSPTIF